MGARGPGAALWNRWPGLDWGSQAQPSAEAPGCPQTLLRGARGVFSSAGPGARRADSVNWAGPAEPGPGSTARGKPTPDCAPACCSPASVHTDRTGTRRWASLG